MTLPRAIGAVVLGTPTTCQTPLSGHRSPVRAVLPTAIRTPQCWARRALVVGPVEQTETVLLRTDESTVFGSHGEASRSLARSKGLIAAVCSTIGNGGA